MLLSLNEVQSGLDAYFEPLEPALTGFRLKSPGLSPQDLNRVKQLHGKLPPSFLDPIKNFSFGGFTLGPVQFGHSTSYADDLCLRNQGSIDPWWGPGARPKDLLLVGNSDPFALLLHCPSGQIDVFDHSKSWEQRCRAAPSFDHLIRGLGTLLLRRLKAQPLSPTWIGQFMHSINCERSSDGEQFWT